MLTILNLFGRSPFAPLQAHMEDVAKCIFKLPSLFDTLERGDQNLIEQISREISDMEHNADKKKLDIRKNLPKSLYLSIDRGLLLDILSFQDRIADTAEDVAILVTLKPLVLLKEFKEDFLVFLKKNIETFEKVLQISREMHDLIESSFGGPEAKRIKGFIDEVSFKEHEVDLIQRQLIKNLFAAENSLTFVTFYQWQRIFEAIAAISNLSENLANRIGLTLELK